MRRGLAWAGALAAVALVGLVAAALLVPLPASPPGPEPGRSLYQIHCATCHGPDGRGRTWRARLLLLEPGDVTARGIAALPDQYLADVIRHGGTNFGKPGMPSFGFALGDAEIQALVAYLRALPGATAGRRHNAPHRSEEDASMRAHLETRPLRPISG